MPMKPNAWKRYEAGSLVRCPSFTNTGERCMKAQDRVGKDTRVYIRIAVGAVTGLERVCRGCGTRLEIAVEKEERDVG